MKNSVQVITILILLLLFMSGGHIRKVDAAIEWQSNVTATANGASSITINQPSVWAQNDVMIAQIWANGNWAGVLGVNPPSGWTQIYKSDNTSGTYYPTLVTFYHVAGASEPSSYTFTFTNYSGGAYGAGIITVFRGVSTTSPIEISNAQTVGNSGSQTTSYSTQSVTTTQPSMLLLNFSGNCATGTWSLPGYSVNTNNLSGGCTGGSSYYYQQSSAGSTGTFTATAPSNSYGNAGVIALKPKGVTVTTTGNAGYSYNYFYASGTVNNETGNTVWYGTKWGAGSAYSSTSCQNLPNTTAYTTVSNGYNGSVTPYVSASASTLYYFCVYAYDSTTGIYYYSPTTSSLTTSSPQPPTMERVTKGEITTTTANITGNVAGENGASITAKGICYSSTNATPALSQGGTTCTSNGSGTAAYTASISGLTPNTLYYFRSYATNSAGTGYSSVDTFTTETTPPAGFPQVVSTNGLYDRTNSTTHNVIMPAVVDANDLLIVVTTNDGSATVTTPSGWTQLFTTANSTSLRLSAYYKFAAGTEDGTSVNFATSASEILTAQVYRITGALAVESGNATTGTSTTPNPPSLTPSWGAVDTLWLGAMGADNGSIVVSAYPTNYTNGRVDMDTYSSSTTYASTVTARRYLNSSSENPGTFTLTGSNAWVANTIAIRSMPSVPTITSPTSSYGSTTATLGGNITSEGASAVDIRGVCYSITSTNSSPQHGGNGVTCVNHATGGAGVFTVDVTGLSPLTNYSFKAFAHNTQGYAYTSADTFTTLTNAPTGVTTLNETNLISYKVTFNGTANPNGSQAYGYFRYFTSAPNCTVDSGGYRVPSDPSQDYNLGSGTSPVNFSINSSSAIPLSPNTNYWYCAYARNVVAGPGSPGTSAASGYDTFTTPIGPVSGCDAPSTGNLTISEQCSFPATDYDGVDAGTDTDNSGRITLSSGGKLTILPGQRIGRGSIVFSGGSLILVNGGASMIRGGVWLKDSDGDGYLDQPIQKIVSATQPSGYVRRAQAYTLPQYNNTSTFQYASGFYNAETTAPTYLDCDTTNGYIFQNVANLVKDQDQDRYKTSAAAATQCVGDTQVAPNGRTYYKDSTGAYTWLASADTLGSGATDCQDNPNGAPCAPVNSSGTNGTNPSAVAASTTQINLSWGINTAGGAVPTRDSYDVYICGLNQSACGSPSIVNVSSATTTYSNSGITCSASPYYYRIVAKNTAGNTQSNIFSGTTSTCAVAPTVTTPTHSSVTSSGATLGANVTSDGGATVTSRGTCWGTSPSPTGNCASTSGTTGVFTHARTGMPSNTLIYYRGYAVNSAGTGYSSDGTFTTSKKANGETCSSASECVSNICYVDDDNDRYAPSSGTATCRASSQLGGTDCYDGNANAKPGQTTYYSSDRGDGSFDYDCDSSTTTLYPPATEIGAGTCGTSQVYNAGGVLGFCANPTGVYGWCTSYTWGAPQTCGQTFYYMIDSSTYAGSYNATPGSSCYPLVFYASFTAQGCK